MAEKLDWITTDEERFLYLFAQGWGNVLAIAYLFHCLTRGYSDPAIYCWKATELAMKLVRKPDVHA